MLKLVEKYSSLIIDLILIVGISGFFYCFVPYNEALLYNPDEGVELIKTRLVDAGYVLYDQIWSDQPPAYTWILVGWGNIFGKTVADARLLTIIFSILLIISFRRIISIFYNSLISISAVFSLFFSTYYIQLSVSVMKAIPSLALGMTSLYLLVSTRHSSKKSKIFAAVVSGLIVATSLQIKFWVISLLPMFFVYFLGDEIHQLRKPPKPNIKKYISLFLSQQNLAFSSSLVGSFLLIIVATGSFKKDQLIESHFQGKIYENVNLLKMLTHPLKEDSWIFALAIAALILLLLRRKAPTLATTLPITWLMTAVILFLNHRPIWFHYYPMFAIPIVWLSSYSLHSLFWGLKRSLNLEIETINKKGFQKYSENLTNIQIKALLSALIAALVLLIPVFPERGNILSYVKYGKGNSFERDQVLIGEMINRINEYRDFTQWLYTDIPILASYTQLLIPPEVAVVTKKSTRDGSDYDEKLLNSLQKYQPEQIFLGSFYKDAINKPIQDYIASNYDLVFQDEKIHHYILKSIQINKQ